MTYGEQGDELDELSDFDSRRRKRLECLLGAYASQGEVSGYYMGLLASLDDPEAQREFTAYINSGQAKTWDDVREQHAALRGGARGVREPGPGPDLHRKGPAGRSGRVQPSTYKDLSAEERRRLSPEEIDQLSAQYR